MAAVPMAGRSVLSLHYSIFRTAFQVPGSRRRLENGANQSKCRLSSHSDSSDVRRLLVSTGRPLFVSRLVRKLRQDGNGERSFEGEESTIWTAASLYGAAADTTVITLTVFALVMIRFRKRKGRAQEEIDLVVGISGLPSFPDRENLPCVAAMAKEANHTLVAHLTHVLSTYGHRRN
jgi:hypothetical protein